MNVFDLDMVEAKKVLFIKPIFEDDFPEKGMKAWLTDIELNKEVGCYKLYFDFLEFEEENDKYFKAEYYDGYGDPKLTAKDADLYFHKYSVCFGDAEWSDEENNKKLEKYLKIVD